MITGVAVIRAFSKKDKKTADMPKSRHVRVIWLCEMKRKKSKAWPDSSGRGRRIGAGASNTKGSVPRTTRAPKDEVLSPARETMKTRFHVSGLAMKKAPPVHAPIRKLTSDTAAEKSGSSNTQTLGRRGETKVVQLELDEPK